MKKNKRLSKKEEYNLILKKYKDSNPLLDNNKKTKKLLIKINFIIKS